METRLRDPGCKLCPLGIFAKTICIDGRGSRDAEVLQVGTAPGDVDDAQGTPLSGKAGKILDKANQMAGISPRVTLLVRCKPPGSMDPTDDQIAICSQYLDREIASMPNLKVIVPLGDVAQKHFLGKGAGILKRAGIPVKIQVRRYGDSDATPHAQGLPGPRHGAEAGDHVVPHEDGGQHVQGGEAAGDHPVRGGPAPQDPRHLEAEGGPGLRPREGSPDVRKSINQQVAQAQTLPPATEIPFSPQTRVYIRNLTIYQSK